MTLLALILVLISAFMHAGWNLLSKRQHPSAAFFLVASLSGALLLAPALVLYRDTLLHPITARIWMFLLITGFFQALYYVSLAGAYRAGDMSVAYPLARSSPVIVVTIVTLFLGRGDQISELCIAGIILVVSGCFLIPLKHFRDLRLQNYLNPICGLALLAGAGTSGYSIVDDEALRQLRTHAQVTIGHTQLTLIYACLEALAASLWLSLFVLLRRRGRLNLSQVLRTNKRHAVLAGTAIYLTYGIVLIALAFVDNVSYVVGFRQLSIPLGATFSILIFKERPYAPKLAGVAIMFIGLTLIAIG